MANGLAGPKLKIQRAEGHLRELAGVVEDYLNSSPIQIDVRRDQTALTYYVTHADNPPTVVPAIAGDVIQNLRTALDHIAYQLALAGSPSSQQLKNVSFPIFKDHTSYLQGRTGRTHGMSRAAIAALDQTRPYGGGDDILWCIHELNLIDKHRLLLTVGSALQYERVSGDFLVRGAMSMFPPGAPERAQVAPQLLGKAATGVAYSYSRKFP